MVVTALGDLAAAIKVRIGTFSAVTSLMGAASGNIAPLRQKAWSLPGYAILIETGKGGPGERDGGRQCERVQITCYGPDERTAHLLWRTLHFWLCPPSGSGRLSCFSAAGVWVDKVEQEGGPLRLVDPDAGWPLTTAPYLFTYDAEAAG